MYWMIETNLITLSIKGWWLTCVVLLWQQCLIVLFGKRSANWEAVSKNWKAWLHLAINKWLHSSNSFPSLVAPLEYYVLLALPLQSCQREIIHGTVLTGGLFNLAVLYTIHVSRRMSDCSRKDLFVSLEVYVSSQLDEEKGQQSLIPERQWYRK